MLLGWEMTEELTKIERLSEEVLLLSRNTLLVNLRFLDINGFSVGGSARKTHKRFVGKQHKPS